MLDEWIAGSIGEDYPIRRPELDRRILSKLDQAIGRAALGSRFYLERFRNIKIRSFSEFERLPFTTPEELRQSASRMLLVSGGEIERIITLPTSGSDGMPKRVFFSREDLLGTVEFFTHGLNEFVKANDRVLLLLPGNNPDGLNDLIRRALIRLGCESFYFGYPGPERLGELTERIIEDRITFLIGTARAIAASARFSEEMGLSGTIALHGVLTAAAYVPEEDCREIRRIWNCDVNEYYGMTETGFAGAVGCSVPGGYHIWESGLYVEIVDPLTGEVLPDGETGEIVITTLTPRAMPLIRYRTGDISRILPGKCECGSCLKRLERVRERPDGKKYENVYYGNAYQRFPKILKQKKGHPE